MFIIEKWSSFPKTLLSDSQGQFHARCMPHCPTANVLSFGVIASTSTRTLWNQPSLFWSCLQSPLVPPLCCTHVPFASGICILHVLGAWPEDKAIWRAGHQTVHISCFIQSTVLAFLRQHLRNPSEQFCSVGWKQAFGMCYFQMTGSKDIWGVEK